MSLFYIQIITSFLVGGFFIGLLTLIAEKTPKKYSGIILAIPSTSILGFFFLGWVTSAQAVADIVPFSLIPLGISPLFTTCYVYFAYQFNALKLAKKYKVILSYLVSILIWALLAIPVTIYQFNSLYINIGICIFLIFLTHYLIHLFDVPEKQEVVHYTFPQQLGRMIFVGIIISVVVILSKLLNPFWGGLFSMFPSAIGSSLIIYHLHHSPRSMAAIVQKAPIGLLSILVYALVVRWSFPLYGIIWGSLISLMMSLIASLLLARFQRS